MNDMNMQRNPKPPLMLKPANYTCLMENDESFLDGILSSEGIQNSSISQQLIGTSGQNGLNQLQANMKRQLPLQYWNEVGSNGDSVAKRFHGDLNSVDQSAGGNDQENNSFASMLNQLPQSNTPFHPNSTTVLLGSLGLGDGVMRSQFQLPSMNWNS